MGGIRSQFLDVIECEDFSRNILSIKFYRKSGDNELKQGSKVIVREGQAVAFVKGGQLADVLGPGTYPLNTKNFPVLSSLKAFPFGFVSPVISDVYFINTKQVLDNKWGTKNPIIKRDSECGMVRLRAFGNFSFRVYDPKLFMREVFGSKGIVFTPEVVGYLGSIISETLAEVIGNSDMSVLDIASSYKVFSSELKEKANVSVNSLGIEFVDVIIENVSLPDNVEELIDEQSGIGLAKKDMDTFMQYQTARAMRDASKQKGGLAGLGAGLAVGKKMAGAIENVPESTSATRSNSTTKADQLRELKSLLDEGILSQEEFESEKGKILNS